MTQFSQTRKGDSKMLRNLYENLLANARYDNCFYLLFPDFKYFEQYYEYIVIHTHTHTHTH